MKTATKTKTMCDDWAMNDVYLSFDEMAVHEIMTNNGYSNRLGTKANIAQFRIDMKVYMNKMIEAQTEKAVERNKMKAVHCGPLCECASKGPFILNNLSDDTTIKKCCSTGYKATYSKKIASKDDLHWTVKAKAAPDCCMSLIESV